MRVSLGPTDRPMDEPSGRLSRVTEAHSHSFFEYAPQRAWQPSVNIYEAKEAFFICVELAGVKVGDIDVRTEKNLLMISGRRADPQPRGEQGSLCVHLMEIESGEFQRELRLPANVAVERVEASYREGLLWVKLPKKNPSA